MPEKRLVVTRADDNIKEMCNLTHPLLKRYADKCNADFDVIFDPGNLHPHYRILQLYDLFRKYDRIAVLDSDILILKDCPDIFKEVPATLIGSIFEDKGTRTQDRRTHIRDIQKQLVNVGWKTGYINTGVCVFSKLHQEIFKYAEGQILWEDFGYDDVYLGYMAKIYKFDIHELSIKWNFMSMFEEPWSSQNRMRDAYIIHYAGTGFFINIDRLKQMKQDYLLLKRYGKLI